MEEELRNEKFKKFVVVEEKRDKDNEFKNVKFKNNEEGENIEMYKKKDENNK
jgi:hypothetical protein